MTLIKCLPAPLCPRSTTRSLQTSSYRTLLFVRSVFLSRAAAFNREIFIFKTSIVVCGQQVPLWQFLLRYFRSKQCGRPLWVSNHRRSSLPSWKTGGRRLAVQLLGFSTADWCQDAREWSSLYFKSSEVFKSHFVIVITFEWELQEATRQMNESVVHGTTSSVVSARWTIVCLQLGKLTQFP